FGRTYWRSVLTGHYGATVIALECFGKQRAVNGETNFAHGRAVYTVGRLVGRFLYLDLAQFQADSVVAQKVIRHQARILVGSFLNELRNLVVMAPKFLRLQNSQAFGRHAMVDF